MIVFYQIVGVVLVVWTACLLSYKLGKREEELKELNNRAEEQKRANEVMDNVRNANIDSVRDRLQNLSDD